MSRLDKFVIPTIIVNHVNKKKHRIEQRFAELKPRRRFGTFSTFKPLPKFIIPGSNLALGQTRKKYKHASK